MTLCTPAWKTSCKCQVDCGLPRKNSMLAHVETFPFSIFFLQLLIPLSLTCNEDPIPRISMREGGPRISAGLRLNLSILIHYQYSKLHWRPASIMHSRFFSDYLLYAQWGFKRPLWMHHGAQRWIATNPPIGARMAHVVQRCPTSVYLESCSHRDSVGMTGAGSDRFS